MKKLFFKFLIFSFFLGAAVPAFAQTTTVSTQTILQTLQQQLATLQMQFNALVQARAQVGASIGAVIQTTMLLRNLREGMSGDDVKTLQAILAKYPDIYPEGLITGFYGKATARAVARFQAREELPTIGVVGPRTLAKLSAELAMDPITIEAGDEVTNGQTRPCAIVPPGHLIAPGWLRKHDGVNPIVPMCQILPPGIAAKVDVAVIFGVAANSVFNTSAHIVWQTNKPATSVIWYGTVSPVVKGGTTLRASSAAMETSHDLALTGLSANTTYYFVLESTDASGNTTVSAEHMFRTSNTIDTGAPVISNVSVGGVTNANAHTMWTTNERATSKVWYSTGSVVIGGSGTLSASSGVTETNHDLLITGLAANTTYYYVVESTDASGNRTLSAQYSFTTSASVDTTAPVISSITASVLTSGSARITWNTNESANTKVWYGTNSSVSAGNGTLMANESLVASHDVTLTGLSASTTYYYVVESTDASGNRTISGQGSFMTSGQASASDTMPPLLTGVSATLITSSSARILWTTDESSDSRVWFTTTTPLVVTANTSMTSNASMSLAHDVTLTGLSANTTYYFMAGSRDASGNVGTSAQFSFTTHGQ